MQDRYAGDVGDYGKVALLRALSEDLRLGVVWYRNNEAEINSDGRHVEYSIHRSCNPVLHDSLVKVARAHNRCIEALQAPGIFPTGTRFYDRSLPKFRCGSDRMSRESALASRTAWAENAYRMMDGLDIVFLDPDNGISPRTSRAWKKSANKYAFLDEIQAFAHATSTLVIYQHQRRQSLRDQVTEQLSTLRAIRPRTYPVSFHIRSPRIYFVLPADDSTMEMMWRRTKAFLVGPWGQRGRFKIHAV